MIENNVDIGKKNVEYYIHILTTAKEKDTSRKIARPTKIWGMDPGIRTLVKVYSVTDGEVCTTE